MFRSSLHVRDAQGERDFRWRGGDVSRLEALTDAVFALSLTLLVVTLDVPRTFPELLEAFRQVPAFLACFALIGWLWVCSYRFHRRYGLEDAPTIALTFVLLFLVLLYVYPLKFLMTSLWNGMLGRGLAVLDELGRPLLNPETGEPLRAFLPADARYLMLLYGGGYAAIFLVFSALTTHAFRLRRVLQLDERELLMTRGTLCEEGIQAGVGLTSAALAWCGWTAWSGLIFFSIAPLLWWNGWRRGRRVAALRPVHEEPPP